MLNVMCGAIAEVDWFILQKHGQLSREARQKYFIGHSVVTRISNSFKLRYYWYLCFVIAEF